MILVRLVDLIFSGRLGLLSGIGSWVAVLASKICAGTAFGQAWQGFWVADDVYRVGAVGHVCQGYLLATGIGRRLFFASVSLVDRLGFCLTG